MQIILKKISSTMTFIVLFSVYFIYPSTSRFNLGSEELSAWSGNISGIKEFFSSVARRASPVFSGSSYVRYKACDGYADLEKKFKSFGVKDFLSLLSPLQLDHVMSIARSGVDTISQDIVDYRLKNCFEDCNSFKEHLATISDTFSNINYFYMILRGFRGCSNSKDLFLVNRTVTEKFEQSLKNPKNNKVSQKKHLEWCTIFDSFYKCYEKGNAEIEDYQNNINSLKDLSLFACSLYSVYFAKELAMNFSQALQKMFYYNFLWFFKVKNVRFGVPSFQEFFLLHKGKASMLIIKNFIKQYNDHMFNFIIVTIPVLYIIFCTLDAYKKLCISKNSMNDILDEIEKRLDCKPIEPGGPSKFFAYLRFQKRKDNYIKEVVIDILKSFGMFFYSSPDAVKFSEPFFPTFYQIVKKCALIIKINELEEKEPLRFYETVFNLYIHAYCQALLKLNYPFFQFPENDDAFSFKNIYVSNKTSVAKSPEIPMIKDVVPAKLLVIGAAGSGKTNFLQYILYNATAPLVSGEVKRPGFFGLMGVGIGMQVTTSLPISDSSRLSQYSNAQEIKLYYDYLSKHYSYKDSIVIVDELGSQLPANIFIRDQACEEFLKFIKKCNFVLSTHNRCIAQHLEKEKAEIYEMKMSINENQIIYPREAQRVNDVSSSLWLNGLENSNGLSDAQVYIKNFVGDAVLSLE